MSASPHHPPLPCLSAHPASVEKQGRPSPASSFDPAFAMADHSCLYVYHTPTTKLSRRISKRHGASPAHPRPTLLMCSPPTQSKPLQIPRRCHRRRNALARSCTRQRRRVHSVSPFEARSAPASAVRVRVPSHATPGHRPATRRASKRTDLAFPLTSERPTPAERRPLLSTPARQELRVRYSFSNLSWNSGACALAFSADLPTSNGCAALRILRRPRLAKQDAHE